MEKNKLRWKIARIKHWMKVRLYGLKVSCKIFDNPENLEKAYREEDYHDQLVKKSAALLNGSGPTEILGGKYIGTIPHDWEDRINAKIAQRNREAGDADDKGNENV